VIPRPGDELLFEFVDWPVAVLTVVSVRTVTDLDGTTLHRVRTTSEHPGPPWSSYDREWWGWFVAEYMRRIPGPVVPEAPIGSFDQPDIFELLEN
jgi:hypothetical protein